MISTWTKGPDFWQCPHYPVTALHDTINRYVMISLKYFGIDCLKFERFFQQRKHQKTSAKI